MADGKIDEWSWVAAFHQVTACHTCMHNRNKLENTQRGQTSTNAKCTWTIKLWLPPPKPKVIWDVSPDWSWSDCLPDHSQNVVDSFLRLYKSFCQVAWKATSDGMRNANKCPKTLYCAIWGKWKSDLQFVSGTRSPPKVNQFFRLVGTIITPSFN